MADPQRKPGSKQEKGSPQNPSPAPHNPQDPSREQNVLRGSERTTPRTVPASGTTPGQTAGYGGARTEFADSERVDPERTPNVRGGAGAGPGAQRKGAGREEE